MAPSTSLLQALLQDEQDSYKTNPFIGAGTGLASAPLNYDTGSTGGNLLVTALKGLGAGILQGYGKSQADEENALRQGRLMEALSGSDPTSSLQSLTRSDPSFSKYATLYGLEDAQRKQQIADEENKLRLQTKYSKLIDIDPTGQVRALPGAAESLAGIEGAQARAKADASNLSALEYEPTLEAQKLQNKLAIEAPIRQMDLAKMANQGVDDLTKSYESFGPTKLFVEKVKPTYQQFQQRIKDPNSVNDSLLIKLALHAIEPESVVTVGEEASIRNSQSIPEGIKGQLISALGSGGRLSTKTKQTLKSAVEEKYGIFKSLVDEKYKNVSDAAKRRSYPVQDIPNYSGFEDSSSILSDMAGQGSAAPRVHNLTGLDNDALINLLRNAK